METSSSTSVKGERRVPREDWWAEVRAVFVKDVRSEWRTRSAVSTILMFALTTMMIISFTVSTEGAGFTMGYFEEGGRMVLKAAQTDTRAELLASIYWIILYFSASAGLPRVFVKEEEMRTAGALRLTASHSAVLWGKMLFNLALMELVTVFVLPVFLLFFHPTVESWGMLIGHLILGAAAMCGTATILGAIVARASNRGYLMVILGFGPLLPILQFCISGTASSLHQGHGNYLIPLVSYLVVMLVVSSALFEKVWAD